MVVIKKLYDYDFARGGIKGTIISYIYLVEVQVRSGEVGELAGEQCL